MYLYCNEIYQTLYQYRNRGSWFNLNVKSGSDETFWENMIRCIIGDWDKYQQGQEPVRQMQSADLLL